MYFYLAADTAVARQSCPDRRAVAAVGVVVLVIVCFDAKEGIVGNFVDIVGLLVLLEVAVVVAVDGGLMIVVEGRKPLAVSAIVVVGKTDSVDLVVVAVAAAAEVVVVFDYLQDRI